MLCFQFSFASFRFSLSLPRLTSRGIFPRMPGQISRSELKRIRLIGPTGLIFFCLPSSHSPRLPACLLLIFPLCSSCFHLIFPLCSSCLLLASPSIASGHSPHFSLKYRVQAHTHTGRVTILRETAHPAGPFFPFSDGKKAKKGGQNGQKTGKNKKNRKKIEKNAKKGLKKVGDRVN